MEAVLFACMTSRWAFPHSALTDSEKYLFNYKRLLFKQERALDLLRPLFLIWFCLGGRSVHQDKLLPLFPLSLPGPLRQPLGEWAPPKGEGARGGQDQEQDGVSGLKPSALQSLTPFLKSSVTWSSSQELTVVCPVCREPLTYDMGQLLSAPAPQLPEVKPLPRVLLEPHDRTRGENGPVLPGGRGSDQFKLQAEVEWAPEAAGEAEVSRWRHRPGGRVQSFSHPHQRGQRSTFCLMERCSSEILKRARWFSFVDPADCCWKWKHRCWRVARPPRTLWCRWRQSGPTCTGVVPL